MLKKLRKKAWIITLVVFLAGISLVFAQNKVAPIMGNVMDVFSIDMATAGWLSSIFNVIALITALPAAFILSRFGPRTCGIVALACAVAGCFLGIFSGNLGTLMFSRVVEGIGVGIISVVAPALISMWFPAQKRGFPMGVWGAWQMVAQSLTFFIGDYLTTTFGWRGLWYVGLAILVIAFILYLLKVKSPPKEYNHADVEHHTVSLFEGLKVPSVWFASISTMCFCFACFGFANWVASYWVYAFGWTEATANGYVSFIYFIEIFLVIGVGFALNHIKNRKLICELAHLLYMLVLLVCFRMNNPAFIIPFCIIYALAEGSIPTTFWTLIAQTVPKPELAGIAIGVLGMTSNIGMLFGPPVAGWFIQNFGWNLGSIPMVVAAFFGLLFFTFVKVYPASKKDESIESESTVSAD